jgi:hypothetical protein
MASHVCAMTSASILAASSLASWISPLGGELSMYFRKTKFAVTSMNVVHRLRLV